MQLHRTAPVALALIGLCAACTSSSKSEATVSGAPSLAFATLEHDFGEVQAGQSLTYQFTFENVGDQPLELGKPHGS